MHLLGGSIPGGQWEIHGSSRFPFCLPPHQSPHLTGRRLTFKVGKCKHLKSCLREHVFLAQASVRPLLHVLIHHKRKPYAGTHRCTSAVSFLVSINNPTLFYNFDFMWPWVYKILLIFCGKPDWSLCEAPMRKSAISSFAVWWLETAHVYFVFLDFPW